MMRVTEFDEDNDPTVHVFRDEDHCRQWLSESEENLTEDMIDELLRDGETEDGKWALNDGYYTIDHTKEK